jgi:hypothetical protein
MQDYFPEEYDMNSRSFVGKIFIVALFLYAGCKDNTAEPGGQNATVKTTTISGAVVDSNGQAISVASIKDINRLKTTDISGTDGSFALQMQTTANYDARIVTLRQGYIPDTTDVVSIIPGETRNITIRLQRDWSQGVVGSTGTDYISSIKLLSAPTDISVRGTGLPETAELVFQGYDKSGLPVDINHSSLMSFTLSAPDLGAELTITSCPTDSIGKAKTVLRAGTISGVVQVLATTIVNGVVKQSSVIKVSINAGLPDQRHFSLSANRYNFAALNWDGEKDAITVNMADKYSNPVSPNTTVYFCSTHGKMVTNGSLSNAFGAITKDYISQDPRPVLNDSAWGPQGAYKIVLPVGWTRVYAQTFNDARQVVQDSLDILWTGVPYLDNNGLSGSQTITHNSGLSGFIFTIRDQNGNPLTSGTVVTLTCDGAKISSTIPDGAFPDMTLPGLGSTIFSASLSDGDGGTAPTVPKVSDFIVKVTHPLAGSYSYRLATVTIQ